MRVIAGKYKKKQLTAARGMTSRPTTDKVKENIFNILGPLSGKGLDLFAGSGGLGIEAISRGLDSVIFVDGSNDAVRAIKQNLETISEHTEVYRNDALRALKALNKREMQFDIIFLDPPYRKDLISKSLSLIASYNLLSPDGLIMCECDKEETIDPLVFEWVKEEIYGSIKITILRGRTDDN